MRSTGNEGLSRTKSRWNSNVESEEYRQCPIIPSRCSLTLAEAGPPSRFDELGNNLGTITPKQQGRRGSRAHQEARHPVSLQRLRSSSREGIPLRSQISNPGTAGDRSVSGLRRCSQLKRREPFSGFAADPRLGSTRARARYTCARIVCSHEHHALDRRSARRRCPQARAGSRDQPQPTHP